MWFLLNRSERNAVKYSLGSEHKLRGYIYAADIEYSTTKKKLLLFGFELYGAVCCVGIIMDPLKETGESLTVTELQYASANLCACG